MSLVSGPGRGGGGVADTEEELCIDKHVAYIQSLNKVRHPPHLSVVPNIQMAKTDPF